VPPGDAPALAAAIEQLAADPDRRAAMGAAGRAKAVRDFDQRRQIEVVLGVYRELLERPGGRHRA
jgi:glycosyltransferase involved in cell wall biosynthesis